MTRAPTSRAWSSERLRRDAEVNLSRILVAARDVFAEQGYEASMEDIAAGADVGVGTLYRRFPNKEDLLNAVVEAAHERKRQIAEAVLTDVPPEDGVFEFVRRCIAVPSCWRATISAPPWRSSRTGLGQTAPLLEEILDRSRPRRVRASRHRGDGHRRGPHGRPVDSGRLRHEILQAVAALPRAAPRRPATRACVAGPRSTQRRPAGPDPPPPLTGRRWRPDVLPIQPYKSRGSQHVRPVSWGSCSAGEGMPHS